MCIKYVVDTTERTFVVREATVQYYSDRDLICMYEGNTIKVKKGNYFDTYEKAYEKMQEIIFIGKYKTRKMNKHTNSWKCAYCGQVLYDKKDVTVDHIVPKSKGGQTNDKNLVISCKSCNGLKSSKSKEHYVRLLRSNSRRKVKSPCMYSKKIRYSAHNKHGKNMESIARMDGNNISVKYISNYVNIVDRALERHNNRHNVVTR